jgi:hypothetical protein
MQTNSNTLDYPSLTSKDLRLLLHPFSPARQRALLFALHLRRTPAEVILLDVKSATRLAKTPFSKALLDAQPRHIHLNYAFWEYIANSPVAAPLFGLEAQAKLLDPPFDQLTLAFQNLILIDSQADRLHFETAMQ